MDESPQLEASSEPVVDPEVDTATADSASEPALEKVDIPVDTEPAGSEESDPRPRSRRGHKS